MGDLLERLRERAESYRLGGPSAEHTASMLDLAAAEIEKLRRGGEETFKLALMHQSRATAAEAKVAEMRERYENWKPISEPPHEQRISEGALLAFYMPPDPAEEDASETMWVGPWVDRPSDATMWCQITQPNWPRALSDGGAQ